MTTAAPMIYSYIGRSLVSGTAKDKLRVAVPAAGWHRNALIGSNAVAAKPNANVAAIVSVCLKTQDIITIQLIPINRIKAKILKTSTSP